MYAAGMLEGYLTSYQIYYSWYQQWNSDGGSNDFDDSIIDKVNNWTTTQRTWMEKQISNNPNSQYWKYVSGLTNQYDGQRYGYSIAKKKFDLPSSKLDNDDDFAWQFMTGNTDLDDLLNVLDPSRLPDWNKMTPNQILNYKLKHTRCSSLVKVTPELDNIFFSHSTWYVLYCISVIHYP